MIKKHPFISAIVILLAVLVLAFVITGCIIMNAAKGTDGDFQYLVVLGTTVHGSKPSSQLQDRIHAAYAYLSAHPDVICVVSGGKGDAENLSEAQCMYNELTRLGISPDRILLEDRATSTVENLQFSLALIEQHSNSRPDTIGLLSSEYHLLRANLFAQRENLSAVTVPAPSTDFPLFVKMFLREIVMVWYYSIIGG